MSENETPDNEKLDPVTSLSCMVSFSVESLVRNDKITPDEAIRAIASALWATVVAYSAPEHLKENSEFAVDVFSSCKEAAFLASKELEFDEAHHGSQWGNA